MLTNSRRTLLTGLLALAAFGPISTTALAADVGLAPTAVVEKVSSEVLATIKADPAMLAGDVDKIITLVDSKVMPHVDFSRMAGGAVGPAWRTASPEQKAQVEQQFKLLLVRTYAGAFKLAGDKTVKVFPLRGDANANEVLVKSELQGGSENIKLDYRLQKSPGQGLGWKVYDLSVANTPWMVDSYKQQFAPIINSKGIDGLIAALAAKNKANARR